MSITNERLAELRADWQNNADASASHDLDNTYSLEHVALIDELLSLRKGWMPIESAPRDGKRILACNADKKAGYILVGYFHGGHFTDGAFPMIYVSHWLPLPPPPEGT